MTTKKLSASDRISALENKLMDQQSQIMKMAEIIDEVDRKFVALAKRLNAAISATDSGEVVDTIIQTDNVNKLKAMIDNLVEQKLLTKNDEAEISETSFIVGRHMSKNGDVITPRLQFYVGSLQDEEKSKFIGQKLGHMAISEDEGVMIEVTEIYDVSSESEEKEEVKKEVKKKVTKKTKKEDS